MKLVKHQISCGCSNIQALTPLIRIELPVLVDVDLTGKNETETNRTEMLYSRMGGRHAFEQALISTIEHSSDFNEKDLFKKEYKKDRSNEASRLLTFQLRPSDPHQIPLISNIDKKCSIFWPGVST